MTGFLILLLYAFWFSKFSLKFYFPIIRCRNIECHLVLLKGIFKRLITIRLVYTMKQRTHSKMIFSSSERKVLNHGPSLCWFILVVIPMFKFFLTPRNHVAAREYAFIYIILYKIDRVDRVHLSMYHVHVYIHNKLIRHYSCAETNRIRIQSFSKTGTWSWSDLFKDIVKIKPQS